MGLVPPLGPGIGPLHQAFKSRVIEKGLQPTAQALQPLITVEALRIGDPPLAHEGEQRNVRKRTTPLQKPAFMAIDPLRPAMQDVHTRLLMLVFAGSGIAIGVFEAIQMMLERTIIRRHQLVDLCLLRQAVPACEIAGISLVQGPAHHIHTFINGRPVNKHQNRNGSLRRHLQHGGGLGLEFHFPPLHQEACFENGPAGSHGIRTAPEAVENRQWGHEQ